MSNLFKIYNNKNSMVLAQGWANRPQKQKINSINRHTYKCSLNLWDKVSPETVERENSFQQRDWNNWLPMWKKDLDLSYRTQTQNQFHIKCRHKFER